MIDKNKYNRLREDPSQLQLFGDDVIDEINGIEESTAKKIEVTNITALTDAQLEELKPGDLVIKITGNMKHTYRVTYKEEHKGICISYFDAGYTETVSYDYADGHWTYNSTDVVPIPTLNVGDIINMGTIRVDDEAGYNRAYFYKQFRKAEFDALPDMGLCILMFNTTCVIFPFSKAQENRTLVNAAYNAAGDSSSYRAKLSFVADVDYELYTVKIEFDEAYANALTEATTVRPYGIIRFLSF